MKCQASNKIEVPPNSSQSIKLTIKHGMKVRADCSEDHPMGGNHRHARLELDITQLAMYSHPIHGGKPPSRMILKEDITILRIIPLVYLVPMVELSQGFPRCAW
jgi:hypothetical protein